MTDVVLCNRLVTLKVRNNASSIPKYTIERHDCYTAEGHLTHQMASKKAIQPVLSLHCWSKTSQLFSFMPIPFFAKAPNGYISNIPKGSEFDIISIICEKNISSHTFCNFCLILKCMHLTLQPYFSNESYSNQFGFGYLQQCISPFRAGANWIMRWNDLYLGHLFQRKEVHHIEPYMTVTTGYVSQLHSCSSWILQQKKWKKIFCVFVMLQPKKFNGKQCKNINREVPR